MPNTVKPGGQALPPIGVAGAPGAAGAAGATGAAGAVGAVGLMGPAGPGFPGPSHLTSTITLGPIVGTTQSVSIQLRDVDGHAIVQFLPFVLAIGLPGVTVPGFAIWSLTAGSLVAGSLGGPGLSGVWSALCLTDGNGAAALTLNNGGEAAAFLEILTLVVATGAVFSAPLAVPH